MIDPVSAYLKGVDDNRNAAVRGVLSPLKNLAERMGAAVVLVSHLTKGASANGKHRVSGSIAYVGACRANFLFVPTRATRPAGRCSCSITAATWRRSHRPLAYTIEDQSGRGPQVIWSDEPVTVTVDEALRVRAEMPAQDEGPELRECEKWLKETLAGGRVPAAELRRACEQAGFAWPHPSPRQVARRRGHTPARIRVRLKELLAVTRMRPRNPLISVINATIGPIDAHIMISRSHRSHA